MCKFFVDIKKLVNLIFCHIRTSIELTVLFTPSLRHAKQTVIGEFRSDLSIKCMIDGNFGNVSAGILFSKVAYQGKRW